MQQARLIIDPPSSGDWNMSVDQALLESASRAGTITLRFYRWHAATLSLGYFQNYAARETHTESLECEVTRRASGGGAIVHDHELTYSLCIPSQNRWSSENQRLYRLIHEIIVDALKARDIHCGFFDPSAPVHGGIEFSESRFLCFERRTDGDLVCQGHKICGSAQRRLKNSLLQHGSLLLRRSERAPELPGIFDISGQSCDETLLIDDITAGVAEQLALEFDNGELSTTEAAEAQAAQERKFGNTAWIRKR